MAKVFYVDFKNKKLLGIINDPPPPKLEGEINKISNPYADWDFPRLAQESSRFKQRVEHNGGILNADLCRLGIPLFSELSVKATSVIDRTNSHIYMLQLKANLDILNKVPNG